MLYFSFDFCKMITANQKCPFGQKEAASMIQLLIIADDFTGALDTGVQFATRGACTRVLTNPESDLSAIAPEVTVLVTDAETRHLPAEKAYDIVYRLARQAAELGIPYIYKKTDSALRGNIGAELAAVLDATGRKQLPFLPAFPQMNRTTVNGTHLINGVPVSASVFGIDPFEPVKESNVVKLLHLQTEKNAVSSPAVTAAEQIPAEDGILVFDTASEKELADMGRVLLDADRLHIMAGCAGFGAILSDLLGLGNTNVAMPKLDPRLLVLCGSVNPITLAQIQYAEEEAGFIHLRMRPDQKLTEGYFDTPNGRRYIEGWRRKLADNPYCIIDANDPIDNEPTASYAEEHGMTTEDLRVQISHTLGTIMRQLFDCPDIGTLLITGGDTLLQCMNCVQVYEMEPIGELAAGVVLSRFSLNGTTRFVISKSGGFGKNTLFADIVAQLKA